MELVNASGMAAGYSMATDTHGRESIVAVVKGTFAIPREDEASQLAEQQVPLIETDVFSGEPGFTATVYENDFAPSKPRCDVLLNGSAYAPRGEPAQRVRVCVTVGSWAKKFDVIGHRVWLCGDLVTSASEPEPFIVMPISYENAFGGVDRDHPDQSKHQYYRENYAGVGYHQHKLQAHRKPLPNTEEIGRPITNPSGSYRPMAFGAVGRPWKQRIQYAGTYDQKWLDEVFPFVPRDFKDQYFQAAPADQWIDPPRGGELVELLNLTRSGCVRFTLPVESMPFEFLYKSGEKKRLLGTLDTLLFEPEHERYCMTWRVRLPLRRNIHEVGLIVAGRVPPEGYEEPGRSTRVPGKTHYESLADLVDAEQGENE